MSQKQKAGGMLSRGYGLVIPENSPNYLVGRVLTIIEAIGLKETQEKSVKDLIREEIYKIGFLNEGALFIYPALHDEINRVLNEIKELEEKDTSDTRMSNSYNYKITYEKVIN